MLIVYSSSSQSLNVVYVKTQPLIHLLSGWCWADQSDCERLGVKARQWSAVHSYSTHIQSLSALHGANLQSSHFVNGLDVERCRWMRMRSIMTRCWKLSVQSQHGSWMLWNGKSLWAKAPAKRDVAHLARTLPGRNASEKASRFHLSYQACTRSPKLANFLSIFLTKTTQLIVFAKHKESCMYFSRPSFGMKKSCLCFSVFRGQEVAREATGRHFEEIRSGIHSQDLQTNPVLCQHHESYFIILYHHDRSLSSNFHTVWYFIILHPLSYIVKEYIIILYHTSSCLVMLFHVW